MDGASAPDSQDLGSRYREIYRFVRRRSRSDSDAEDVTQEVFADAARALGNLALGEAPPVAWLYKVAQRRLVDRARSLERRRREVSGDLALESVRSPQPEYGAEAGEALRAAIEELPREQRRVIVMKLVQGCSFAEIAREVEASEGACRMRFLRGLEQLRALLEQEEVTP